MPRVALIVDDSMLIRHTVSRFLEDRGFVAECATNGAEAMEMMKRVRPDVIITDLIMPKMDGNELINALKASPTTAHIPVVVLKSKGSSIEATFEAQADAAIFKDIEIVAELDRTLRELLEKPKDLIATVRAS